MASPSLEPENETNPDSIHANTETTTHQPEVHIVTVGAASAEETVSAPGPVAMDETLEPPRGHEAEGAELVDPESGEGGGADSQIEKKPGCPHYHRRCKLKAACCGETFWCRHCHNEEKNVGAPKLAHEMDRHAVTHVVCGLCELEQLVGPRCVGCNVVFGNYFCAICKFFDDDLSKSTFHCDACGICRVGGRENFFHCDTCGCCYVLALRDNHRCIQGSMHQNCPVCQENLFHSTIPSRVLKCGHMIHHSCLKELMPTRYSCPLCNESVGDMSDYFRHLDSEVQAFEMPSEYRDLVVQILCNDCHLQSDVTFHVIGLKCPSCSSYNTRRL